MRMRQRMVSGFAGAGLVAGLLLLAPATASADSTPDERLEEKVETALNKTEKLNGLNVDVKDGVTTLSGEVASTSEKAQAERLAKTAGAKKVVNLVAIDADKAIARIKERAQVRKDRIDERAEAAKDAVDKQTEQATNKLEAGAKNAQATADRAAAGTTTQPRATVVDKDGKEVFDPLVTAKVKTRILRDDLLDKSEINVDSEADGRVTLRGTVPSEAAHARALELARTTEGVRKVVDSLTVKAPVVK